MGKSNIWMAFSDLMTGLMIIFLFIAVAYMIEVDRKNQQIKEQIAELDEFVQTRQKLHDKLKNEFRGDTTKWSVGKDLSIKFNNQTILFDPAKWELTPDFKSMLDDFLPRYFDILLKDTLSGSITEVRIEGHTDDVPFPTLNEDPYIANVILSQRRSLSVLLYFQSMPAYQRYTNEEKRKLEFWLTANGLSFGKALDKSGDFVNTSKKPIDRDKSRRVEFRIVTNDIGVVKKILKMDN